jgi:hypothetical protein
LSKTTEEIGLLAGGIAIALLSGPIGVTLLGNMMIANGMIGMGLTMAVSAGAGLLNPPPQDPSNIGPQGQLPVQSPNPLWRILYGIFQFAGSITFVDGPMLNWAGTGSGNPCNNQWIQRVHTLTAHQIAGFLAVVLDGQTFNFGTDLVLLTAANNGGGTIGPIGMWGFVNISNPWAGVIYFAFDCGDPSNFAQPFPMLVAGAQFPGGAVGPILVGSTRWLPTSLQRGRSKVQVLLHYVPSNEGASWGPEGGAPQAYVLGSGRIPTIEFKLAGRLILDYRVVTAWQPSTAYAQSSYVLMGVGSLLTPGVFVQQNSGAVSGAVQPNFAAVLPGTTIADGTGVWKLYGQPNYAAGNGVNTQLNNPGSNKLGGPGGTYLIADAWRGSVPIISGFAIIEAPIGWLQLGSAGSFETGATRPNFSTTVGGVTVDGTGSWTCIGRSIYATCLPDPDGTTNQGGFSNPALVIADYLQTPKNEFGLGAVLTSDSIESVIAAANICDEPVVIEVFT